MTNLVKLTDETDEDVVRHFKLINGDEILGRLEFITTVDNESLHIITDDKDLGEELGKIITFEHLRS